MKSRNGRSGIVAMLGLLVLVGCGRSVSVSSTSPEEYDEFFKSFGFDYEPARSIEQLASWSEVVAVATLVGVEDGRVFGESLDDPNRVTFVNFVFETTTGETYFVGGIPRPPDVDAKAVQRMMPIGARSVIYLQPNHDPNEGYWFNVREDGNEWFFTTPQGWILQHPERGADMPLVEDRGDTGLSDAPGESAPLDAWLPADP